MDKLDRAVLRFLRVLASFALFLVMIVLCFASPGPAAILAGFGILIWLLTRVNVMAKAARQRGQLAEAQQKLLALKPSEPSAQSK